MKETNSLIQQQNNLPNTLEDLSKFVLVGREKLTAVRAEIRAIDKLELAEDVRVQKKEEGQMLGEALLDAETRIGDLLKTIPKAKNQYAKVNGELSDTKYETAKKLGFDENQVKRFETLASNKEVVEQVKAEARENEDIPTRSRVLQLVKEKTKEEQFLENEFKKIENKKAIELNYHNALFKILTLEIKEEEVYVWVEAMMDIEKQRLNDDIDTAIEKFNEIKEIYKKYNKIRRVK